MKIIRYCNNQVTCGQCESILEYSRDDLIKDGDKYYITCPVCGETIYLGSGEKLDDLFNNINNL